MKDGLYMVNTRSICAAFVVRDGEVTTCAPILRKKLDYWKRIAQWIPTDVSIPPPQVSGELCASSSAEDA
jgi:hypothetical protein